MSACDGADADDASGSSVIDGVDAGVRRDRLIVLIGGDDTGPSSSGTVGQSDGRTAGGGPGELVARLRRVCSVAVAEIGVDGAGITVMGSLDGGLNGARDQLAATDGLARRLEDLQLTAGEGPCLDAYRRGRPVLVDDLAAESSRWLGFGPEAVLVGAAALFSLPLQVGAIRLGTLDLHRGTPGELSVGQLADALTLASLATEVLLELAKQPDHAVGDDAGREADIAAVPLAGWLPDVHADVHVAAGMLSVRDGGDVTAALLRLRAHAFAHGQPLHQVARRVITRDLVLDGVEKPAQSGPRADHDAPDGPPAAGPENEEP